MCNVFSSGRQIDLASGQPHHVLILGILAPEVHSEHLLAHCSSYEVLARSLSAQRSSSVFSWAFRHTHNLRAWHPCILVAITLQQQVARLQIRSIRSRSEVCCSTDPSRDLQYLQEKVANMKRGLLVKTTTSDPTIWGPVRNCNRLWLLKPSNWTPLPPQSHIIFGC